MTSTLADRDQVIGALIDNLNEVLDHVGDRDEQLNQLITTFRHVRRRAQGRPRGDPRLARPDLRRSRCRPPTWSRGSATPFVEDIKQLRGVAGNLDRNKAELDRALQVLPIKLEKVGRTAIYGSWFNFYLCQFQGKVQPARRPVTSRSTTTPAPTRCDLG